MEAASIIEGLQLIEKSKPEGKSGYHIRSEHDTIYAGSLDWEMDEHDKLRMEVLGWVADEDIDGWIAHV